MLEITPFPGVRYDPTAGGGDISTLIAPPYDVLDADDKATLLRANPRNIVAVDLPHVPPKYAGPAEVYETAAAQFNAWLADGTLIGDELPAIYLHHQVFEHEGKTLTRRMFVARLRLQPFSEGTILPHEQTFGGPKEDRLALMRASRCQFSAIFAVYADAADQIGSSFASTAARTPDVTGALGDVENRVWVVSDSGVIDAVANTMADKRVYIADGHHRYDTALLYRDFLADQNGGSLPDEHPANYIMFALAGMDDPGCLILPYHRALVSVDFETLMASWADGVEASSADEADMVLYDGRTGTETPVRFTDRSVLEALAPDECSAWRELDYAYLHRYLIDELLHARFGDDQPAVRHLKSADDAKMTARDESGVALLMRATPMEQLKAVSRAGGLMPQKSTCFHPKLATGFVLNPLA